MRRILLVGFALPLLIAPAFGQTAAQHGSSNATMPSAPPGSPAGTVPVAVPMTTQGGTTAMPPPAASGRTAMPAPTTITPSSTPSGTTATTVPTGGAPGANSFTEGQAKTRLEEKGFTSVSELKKDVDGVWRGTAMKDSKSVAVSVDYKGDITGG